jgi:hypothetical protein
LTAANARDWDDKLTLEIVSPHAALALSIEIRCGAGGHGPFLLLAIRPLQIVTEAAM